jgi:hypothetical protein
VSNEYEVFNNSGQGEAFGNDAKAAHRQALRNSLIGKAGHCVLIVGQQQTAFLRAPLQDVRVTAAGQSSLLGK